MSLEFESLAAYKDALVGIGLRVDFVQVLFGESLPPAELAILWLQLDISEVMAVARQPADLILYLLSDKIVDNVSNLSREGIPPRCLHYGWPLVLERPVVNRGLDAALPGTNLHHVGKWPAIVGRGGYWLATSHFSRVYGEASEELYHACQPARVLRYVPWCRS